METVLAFVAGVVVAVLVMRRVRARPAQASGESGAGALEPAPRESVEPAPAPSAAARLQELAAALVPIGDASAHPRELTGNATFMEAVTTLARSSTPLTMAVDYATGANYMMSAAALCALQARPDRESAARAVLRHFPRLAPWAICYALQYFTSLDDPPLLGELVLGAQEYWPQHPLLPALFAEHFRTRIDRGSWPTFGAALETATNAELAQAEAMLRAIDHVATRNLLSELTAWRRMSIDRAYLQGFGRFVERTAAHELLIEHAGNAGPLALAEAAALGDSPRSVLVVGEPRVGKTSLVMLLAARAAARRWAMFEAGAASLMAGQQYFGQLEERLQRLTAELAREKCVIWYAPDFLQLAASGTHAGQSASVLDQVLPAIAAGRVILISETTPHALAIALQRRPGLRSVFEIVRLEQPSEAETRDLGLALAERIERVVGIRIEPPVVDGAMTLARHYLGSAQMPGAALDLLKLTTHRRTTHGGTRVLREDILATLSQQTGMPALVLDDRERVDLSALRAFFTARVIGQDEAVDAVVDRIAMLKAGLTDPGKPIAVFLFAGPTGTGKTELAKTVAEYLFGSDDRLIRLDMSEFQIAESTRKIVGEAGGPPSQSLAASVRKQPFSVVLLDEFEKAHANIWDLFLQVFDDGRLTDASGDTTDFRHTIVILTSNLGARIPQGPGVGFATASGGFSQDQVLRAVHQSFRPEFVNRLDAIIVFRPLTRELMRSILMKELAQVLDRRGLRDREWAVEWEPSAIDFLLDRGFSPTMGARPLKRAIDRYLLAPLAATLVEHRFPEGDQFLFVGSDGRSIQVEFVDPDAEDAVPAPGPAPVPPAEGLSLPRMMLQAAGSAEERDALDASLRGLDERLRSDAWTAIEAALVSEMQQPEFWTRPRRFRALARYALIDRVKAATATAQALRARLDRSAGKDGRHSRDLVGRLAAQLHVLHLGVDDVLLDAPVEVVLAVQPVLDGSRDAAGTHGWCHRLLEMYKRWATERRMQIEEVQVHSSSMPGCLVVSGFGAGRTLAAEAGLHLLEYESSREESARAVARVRVAATPDEVPEAPDRRKAALLEAIDGAPPASAVVRRYRLDSSPLVRDVARGWRTGRADLVLAGHFDLLGDVAGRA
jgi:ATP-dependent Clp protease ATP-binding subunit ClpC